MDDLDLPALRRLMFLHRRRTGVGLNALLGRGGRPAGIDLDGLVDFYRTGEGAVERAQIVTALAFWEALPARRARLVMSGATTPRRERVELTPQARAELRAHWLRVGISVEEFLAGLCGQASGMSARMLYHWMSDEPPARVRKEHLDAVLSAWSALPDGVGSPRRTHFIPFAPYVAAG